MLEPFTLRRLGLGCTLGLVLVARVAAAADAGRLTLEDAFARAINENLGIKMARAEEVAAQAAVLVQEGRFAVELSSTAETLQRTAHGTTLGTQLRYALAINKLFSSGTLLNVTGVGTDVWNRPASLDPVLKTSPPWQTDPFYFADPAYGGLYLTVQQALLRGAGFAVNDAPTEAAQELLAATRIGLEEQQAAQLRDVETAYWRWAAAVRATDIRRTSLALAQVQRDRTAELIRRGRQADTDALLAEQIVADRQDALAVAASDAISMAERLFHLMGVPYTEMTTMVVVPEEFPEVDANVEASDALVKQVAASAYPLRRLGHEQAALEQQARVTEDAAWPELDAVAALRLSGNDQTLGAAYDSSLTAKTYEWIGTVRFSYPLGTNPAVAEAERTRAKLVAQRLAVEEVSRATTLQVVAARRELELALNRITLAALAKRLATEKLRAEEERYGIGRTTMQNLRLFQEDLDQAGLRGLQARVSYMAARAQLDFLLGRFLARRGLVARPAAPERSE